MISVSTLISAAANNPYVWAGAVAAVGGAALYIYLSGRANGKQAERNAALKREIKERGEYENAYKNGLNMAISGRAEWVRKYQNKK